jgi:hypothetical protein
MIPCLKPVQILIRMSFQQHVWFNLDVNFNWAFLSTWQVASLEGS